MDGRHARIVLGVPEHASADDIRSAFRRRALATHPDRGGNRTAFELVVLAFETLQQVTVAKPVPSKASAPPAPEHPPLHPRFSAFDCPRRARPARQFADVLQVAIARAH
jgi:hypothetical protein